MLSATEAEGPSGTGSQRPRAFQSRPPAGACGMVTMGSSRVAQPTKANPLLCRMVAADRLRAMTSRIDLPLDKQGRMSLGRPGLAEGHAVAEPLPDGSGWVLRPARLVT